MSLLSIWGERLYVFLQGFGLFCLALLVIVGLVYLWLCSGKSNDNDE